MSYSLSFSPEFFRGKHSGRTEQCQPSDQPTTVEQAILSLSDETWRRLAREVFGCHPKDLDVESVMQSITETNTCSNLDPPVEVWIDGDGEFRVLVFEE